MLGSLLGCLSLPLDGRGLQAGGAPAPWPPRLHPVASEGGLRKDTEQSLFLVAAALVGGTRGSLSDRPHSCCYFCNIRDAGGTQWEGTAPGVWPSWAGAPPAQGQLPPPPAALPIPGLSPASCTQGLSERHLLLLHLSAPEQGAARNRPSGPHPAPDGARAPNQTCSTTQLSTRETRTPKG